MTRPAVRTLSLAATALLATSALTACSSATGGPASTAASPAATDGAPLAEDAPLSDVDPQDAALAGYVQQVAAAMLSAAAGEVLGADAAFSPETAGTDIPAVFADADAWRAAIAAASQAFTGEGLPVLVMEGSGASASPGTVDPADGITVTATKDGRACTVDIAPIGDPATGVSITPACTAA